MPCPLACSTISLFLCIFTVKTVLVKKPKDKRMTTWEDEVMFECAAEGDVSTPIEITWYFHDVEIDPSNKA